MGIKCFMVTCTERARLSLRRYWGGTDCSGSYHNAETPIGFGTYRRDAEGYLELNEKLDPDETRWPTACSKCGAAVPETAPKQLFSDCVYVDESGQEYSLRKLVPGMMWDAWWMGESMKGPDGKCLVVVCPDGYEWMIDGRASNCTMPEDGGPFESSHRCWVRHGEPPNLTVDKAGRTCAAGGGSIMSRNGYHGFLRNGEFT
jgi:hypothetical protein